MYGLCVAGGKACKSCVSASSFIHLYTNHTHRHADKRKESAQKRLCVEAGASVEAEASVDADAETDLFDFELTPVQMASISSLDCGRRYNDPGEWVNVKFAIFD